ncbi:MAG: cytochrome c oxidase subunit II [Methylococcales bacterium]|nr:cytochrome c oxidase subunit II [Methylococcales bacterium]
MHIDRTEGSFVGFTAVLLVVFFLAVTVGATANGIRVPSPELRVDPKLVATPGIYDGFGDPPEERIRELAPGKYEVYIIAQAWKFSPGSVNFGEPPLTFPVGSTVTFYVTSKDIQHGFRIDNTNITFMVLPGQVSKLTATFDEPGEFNFVCHEYCGVAHHTMFGKLIIEE